MPPSRFSPQIGGFWLKEGVFEAWQGARDLGSHGRFDCRARGLSNRTRRKILDTTGPLWLSSSGPRSQEAMVKESLPRNDDSRCLELSGFGPYHIGSGRSGASSDGRSLWLTNRIFEDLRFIGAKETKERSGICDVKVGKLADG